MCLILNQCHPFPRIAKEDITCYKILELDYKTHADVITPYRKFYICKKDELNNCKGVTVRPEEGIVKSLLCAMINYPCIYSGFIHSYKDEIPISYLKGSVYIQVKCKIPKGSLYYEGKASDNSKDSYVSRELIILKVIDSNYKGICHE